MNTKDVKDRLAEVAAMEDFIEGDAAVVQLKRDAQGVVSAAAIDTMMRQLRKQADGMTEEEASDSTTRMNEEFFILNAGGRFRVGRWMTLGDQREHLTLMTKPDFLSFVENRVSTRGTPLGPLWLTHPERRQYDYAVVQPDGDVPPNVLNLWRGFGVEPTHGDCHVILDHIHTVLCDGNQSHSDYMLNWIAAKMQDPTRVMGVMPVFISEQGAGKGVIFEDLMMRIFGQHGLTITASEQITGKFNAHLLDACYVFADECFFTGDRRAAQHMKRVITGKTLMIEGKGVNARPATSYLGIIAATNMTHAVSIERDDRRTIVGKCSDARHGDTKYFDALFTYIEGDGASHFLQKMLDRDVSSWDAERDRPTTEATLEQREMSLTGVHRWWQTIVEDGMPPNSVISDGGLSAKAWNEGKVDMPRREVVRSFQRWKEKQHSERYESFNPKRFWGQLKQIACFSDAATSTSDREVVFDELSNQIKRLREFLRGL